MEEQKPTTSTLKKLITVYQNPSLAGFAVRWTAVPFVVPFTKPFIWLKFNAEQVCFLWIVLGVISGILLGFGDYWLGILSLVLFHIAAILDGVDGAVARYWKRPTNRGAYLDAVGHAIIKPGILLGMGVGAFFNPPSYIPIQPYIYIIAGSLAAIGIILINIARLKVFEMLIDKDLVAKIMKQKEVFKPTGTNNRSLKQTVLSLFRLDPFSIFYFAVIFKFTAVLVLFYGALLPVWYILRCKNEFETIRRGIDEAKEGEMNISLSSSKH